MDENPYQATDLKSSELGPNPLSRLLQSLLPWFGFNVFVCCLGLVAYGLLRYLASP
jgi:hypothetical protein